MTKTKIMVVDDSDFMRSVIRDIVNEDPNFEIVAEAADGEEALEKIKIFKPDVVTLDLEMPKKNGVTVLDELNHGDANVKVIVVSLYTHENAQITLDCLKMGAVDFLLKPSIEENLNLEQFGKLLVSKIKAASEAKVQKNIDLTTSRADVDHLINNHEQFRSKNHSGVVIIGSSTGGPVALEKVLFQINENFTLPIIIAQHLPERFVESLAERIGKNSKLETVVAQDGMEINPGTIYFIPGGHDGTLIENGLNRVIFSIVKNENEILSPSVDKIMLSAANIYQDKIIGVILTGMGNDGLLGAKIIRALRGTIVVQDEASSAVFGMGKEVIEAGLSDFILPLEYIGKKINNLNKNE